MPSHLQMLAEHKLWQLALRINYSEVQILAGQKQGQAFNWPIGHTGTNLAT